MRIATNDGKGGPPYYSLLLMNTNSKKNLQSQDNQTLLIDDGLVITRMW